MKKDYKKEIDAWKELEQVRRETIRQANIELRRLEEENIKLRAQLNELNTQIIYLRESVLIEGPQPLLHRYIMKKHRKEWKTLWKAIDRLINK